MAVPGLPTCILTGCSIIVFGLIWNAPAATASDLGPHSEAIAGGCTVDPSRGGADMELAEQDEDKVSVNVGQEVLYLCVGNKGVGYIILTCGDGGVWSPNRDCTDQPKVTAHSVAGIGFFAFTFILVTFILLSSAWRQKKSLGRTL